MQTAFPFHSGLIVGDIDIDDTPRNGSLHPYNNFYDYFAVGAVLSIHVKLTEFSDETTVTIESNLSI